ncbi:hypothetical protein CFB84_37170 [Burkholderia aenigmatica]|jgi:hypothetical protein|uniref:Uncharacterized protein n=6 Tax=Burkholderia TaxID=32008 RepID=A0A228HZ26_9BURK|nr:hypothetical protein DCN14_36475 [Burkholderia sp. IDO3]KVR84576.1 hypothetical protein WK24_24985 [Burkholderia vietnamiensis]KVS22024.1 hypothetical protein WK34_21200 [Burkholderia vietnamiensis]OXI35424.1 hypothetical protein CFB84_37170 [Burkholderia aenigmatica]PCD57562.1 hypothetical protein CN645_33175 [Burkholderia sp. IDO3]
MLRASLAFFDSTKLQQGMTFLLEDIMEAALRADFGPQAESIIEQWRRIDPRHEWAEEKIYGRTAQFCAWTRAQRKNGLSGLLSSLDPMYPAFYPIWVRNGVANLVSPEILDTFDGAEWDDPKW